MPEKNESRIVELKDKWMLSSAVSEWDDLIVDLLATVDALKAERDSLLAERSALAGIVEQLREAMNEVEYAKGGSVTRSEKLAKIARILSPAEAARMVDSEKLCEAAKQVRVWRIIDAAKNWKAAREAMAVSTSSAKRHWPTRARKNFEAAEQELLSALAAEKKDVGNG